MKCSESPITTARMTASALSGVVSISQRPRIPSVFLSLPLSYPAYAFITTFVDDRICSVSSNLSTIIS